jgi:citronellyl-CoA dehydrogenase
MLFTADHDEPRRILQKFITAEINPFVDEWEKADIFPAHELFKKLGDLGFLGLNKPVEFGGQGLDYSYAVMMAEELGAIKCGGVPMAIGVQTDMATPALARFGSDEVRREFLTPAISGDAVACVGVSEPGAGSDVASIKTSARSDGDDYVINGGKMWITNGTQADWICLLANTSRRTGPSQQVAHLRADENEGRAGRAQARQNGHALLRHRADFLRQCAGAQAQPYRRGR